MKKYILISAALLTTLSFTLNDVNAKTIKLSKCEIVKPHHSQAERGKKNERFQGSEKRDPLLRMLSEELELTDVQKNKIKELVKEENAKFRKEKMAKRKENHNKIMELIKSDVLTAEQSVKLDELKAKLQNGELADERKNKHLDRLTKDLELTEDQREMLDDLFTEQREKRKAIRNEGSRFSGEMNKEKREEFRRELSQILTSEQLEKFNDLNKSRMKDRKERRLLNEK